MTNPNATWDAELKFDKIIPELCRGAIIGEFVVAKILAKLAEILYCECNILSLPAPIVICGDIHGQFEDLELLFMKASGGPQASVRYLFMGDYVDRGKWSVNTFLLLALRKIKNPDLTYLLRGNHESRMVTQQYGFYNEIKLSYTSSALWNEFMRIFDLLPVAAVVDKQVFSVHGGLSPSLKLLEHVNLFNRKIEIPPSGPLADLMWSDPDEVSAMDWAPNKRGAGFIFNKNPAIRFCHLNRLSFITRSHQLVQGGFQWMFRHRNDSEPFLGKLINVWSAPNYGGTSNNLASVMKFGFDDEPVELVVFDQEGPRITPKGFVYEYFA
jgi:diadenosine tetraphosphatase ApaH/serine/threonine PP2A family protein phosphatase